MKHSQHLRLVHSEEPGERAIAPIRETLDKLNALLDAEHARNDRLEAAIVARESRPALTNR
jgi:hypothetical protein